MWISVGHLMTANNRPSPSHRAARGRRDGFMTVETTTMARVVTKSLSTRPDGVNFPP